MTPPTNPWRNADQRIDEIVNALVKERDALAERVKRLISERDTARMQADRKVALRDEFRALLGTDDIEEGVSRIKAMQAQVKALENERDDLLQWVSNHRPNNEALNARVKELEGENAKLKAWILGLEEIRRHSGKTDKREWNGEIGWLHKGQVAYVGEAKP